MIEKERLQELIEQGATIYSTRWKEEVDLSLPCSVREILLDNGLLVEFLVVDEGNGFTPGYMLDYLTEDVEGAKWEEEFGCIERTERLVLPTWEEVSRDLQNVPAGNYVIKEFDYVSLEYIKYNGVFIGIYTDDYSEKWEATKENYTLACRKAKELFLNGGRNDTD